MIRFDNWTIQADGDILAWQFDNLTRTLAVTGDIPAGWDWVMLVQVGDAMDIIPLTATEGALSAVLTAQQLSISGYYNMQLRATQGDKVKHTNPVSVYIPASLSGDEQWPTVPSEFTEMERRVNEATSRAETAATTAEDSAGKAWTAAGDADAAKTAAQDAAVSAGQSATDAAASERAAAEHKKGVEAAAVLAEGYTSHPPIIGENGNWWTWDGEAYVDSGNPSQGELTRAQGNNLYANALKGMASGTAIRVDDVSPLEHSVSVKVRGKNLFNALVIPVVSKPTTTYVSAVSEGSVTVTVEEGVSDFGSVDCLRTLRQLCPSLVAGKTYTLSALTDATTRKYIHLSAANKQWVFGKPLTLTEDMLNSRVVFYGYNSKADATKYGDCVISNIQIEEGTAATEYTPHVPDLTAVTVLAHEKNLLNTQNFPVQRALENYLYISEVGENYIKVTIPETANVHGSLGTGRTLRQLCPSLVAGKTYVLTAQSPSKLQYMHCLAPANTDLTFGFPKVITEDMLNSVVVVYVDGKDADGNYLHGDTIISNIQLELGDTATEYTPYQEPTEYVPSEDGSCEVASIAPSMTLLTDNPNVSIDCEYNRDINKAFEQLTQAILSMGGNI